MGVVQDQKRIQPGTQVGQGGYIGQIAVHGEHRVAHQKGPARCRCHQVGGVVEVAMAVHRHLRPASGRRR